MILFTGKEAEMPHYLIKFGYTPETWAKLIKQPEDRRKAVGAMAEAVGGKVIDLWYSFGEADGYLLVEAPDNVSAAEVSIVAAASGALRSAETTVLLTVEEMVEAMRKAKEISYTPPGG